MKKRCLSAVAALCILLGSLALASCSDKAADAPTTAPSVTLGGTAATAPEIDLSTCTFDISGECGDNATWKMDSAQGVLVISGTGSMKKYNGATDSPWYANSSLKHIVIENGITEITANAFTVCDKLESISIPASVGKISPEAFLDCSSLKTIGISQHNTIFKNVDGVIYSADTTELLIYPAGLEATEFTVPASVKTVGRYAFASSAYLEKIVVPAGVELIGFRAFHNCDALVDAVLPESGVTLEAGIFDHCDKLANVTLPTDIASIPQMTFLSCPSLVSVSIPESVTKIELKAFMNCTSLTSVALPSKVEAIESMAFSGCTNLASITLPEGLKVIGGSSDSLNGGVKVFENCLALKNITIPASVEVMGSNTFAGWNADQTINLHSASIGDGWHPTWNHSCSAVINNIA